jgi:hypothetical protein
VEERFPTDKLVQNTTQSLVGHEVGLHLHYLTRPTQAGHPNWCPHPTDPEFDALASHIRSFAQMLTERSTSPCPPRRIGNDGGWVQRAEAEADQWRQEIQQIIQSLGPPADH